jgi:hypothetical protein
VDDVKRVADTGATGIDIEIPASQHLLQHAPLAGREGH